MYKYVLILTRKESNKKKDEEILDVFIDISLLFSGAGKIILRIMVINLI